MDPERIRGNIWTVGPNQEDYMIISRRRLLIAGSTAFAGGVVGAPFVARAQQAEFTYKYANNLPTRIR